MDKKTVFPSQPMKALRDIQNKLEHEIGELETDIKDQHDSQIDAKINFSFREKR